MNLELTSDFQNPIIGMNIESNSNPLHDSCPKQSPLTNSLESTDILSRKDNLEPIPSCHDFIDEKPMSDSQYFEQYESSDNMPKAYKGNIQDLKFFLIARITSLVELVSKHFESKGSIKNSRWQFDDKKFIKRIEECSNKAKFKPILASYFDTQIDTVKALYSDNEELFDLLEEFSEKFKTDFANIQVQTDGNEQIKNAPSTKRAKNKPVNYASMTKSKSIEPVELPKKEKKEVPKKPEIIQKEEDPNSRSKRNTKRVSYCEDEKLMKGEKKRAKSTQKAKPASKKSKATEVSKKDKSRCGMQFDMDKLIAYTWRECNVQFSELLSKLSEYEFRWFIDRVRKDYPDCISFEEDGLNLKIGPEQIKDHSALSKDRRKDLMTDELIYLYTYSNYIDEIIRVSTTDIGCESPKDLEDS